MKFCIKNLTVCLILMVLISIFTKCVAQNPFSDAMRTCETYSKQGSIPYDNENFGVLITLQKKGDKCVYKEKIFQDKKSQTLTCNFQQHQWAPIADSMEKFNTAFKKEIIKNPIFEAKLTTNGEVFQKYLADPKNCSITHSK